jgi:hypothetical protein
MSFLCTIIWTLLDCPQGAASIKNFALKRAMRCIHLADVFAPRGLYFLFVE